MVEDNGASAEADRVLSPSATEPVVSALTGDAPSREDAATDFDPWACPWCADTGFDLRGLAHHVWMRCEVVERLANENIDDCRRSHEAFHAEALRQRDSDRSGEADETAQQAQP